MSYKAEQSAPTSLSMWVKALVHLLERSGLDRQDLLKAAQIDEATLDDLDGRIDTSRVGALWHSAEIMSGNDAIGIEVGRLIEPYHLNPLGNTLISCGTVREVINGLGEYAQLLASHVCLLLLEGEENSTLKFAWQGSSTAVSPHAYDAFISSIAIGIEKFTQRKDGLVSISLQRPAPKRIDDFFQFYGCPILFNQAYNEITIDNKLLDEKLLTANPLLQEKSEGVVEQMLSSCGESREIVDIVRFIERDLSNSEMTLSLVAEKLNKSERGVQRLLKENGYTYRSLLETVRKRLALETIVKPGTHQKQIAYKLGYHTQQAFCRAFKQWTGMTPTDYISFASDQEPRQSHQSH